MERICRRPKYLEELVEFAEAYFHFESQLDSIQAGKHRFDWSIRASLLQQIDRIGQLRMLLSNNDCCVDEQTIVKLRKYVASFKPTTLKLTGWNEFEDRSNLTLLRESVGMTAVDRFVAESEGDTVY
ncbi:MAG: hypothetical protein WBE65_01780 [Steroidobacteraceae bacterium]